MAHIRNNCLKENTLQVEINQQCQDISNISGNDCCDELVDGLDNISNQITEVNNDIVEVVEVVEVIDNKIDLFTQQSEECCDTLSDKLDKIDSKLKPRIITKPVYVDRIIYKNIYTIVYKTDYIVSYRPCVNLPGKPIKEEIQVPQKSVIRRIETPKQLDPCKVYEYHLKRDIEESRKRWEKEKYKTYKTFSWMVWQLYSTCKDIWKPKCWEDVYRGVVYEVFGERLPDNKNKKKK